MKKYLSIVLVLTALATQKIYTMEPKKAKPAGREMLASDPAAPFVEGTAKAMVKSGEPYQNKLEAVAKAATISDALALLEDQDPTWAAEYLKDRVNKKGKQPFEVKALNDALVAAVADGNLKRAAILLSHGVKPNISREGSPLVYKAIDANNMEMLGLLLTGTKLAPNMIDESGRTLLIYAVQKENSGAVKQLLANQHVDVNAKDNTGRTALHQAAIRGYSDIVKLLIAHPNIKLNEKTRFGHTALDLARDAQKGEVVEILEAAVASK